LGYSVVTCSSGEDAIKLTSKDRIDMTFIDLKLPDMDGIHVIRKIKDTNTIPVAITAYQSVNSVLDALQSGAYDYIIKPVNINDLEILIAKALVRHKIEEDRKKLMDRYQKASVIMSI